MVLRVIVIFFLLTSFKILQAQNNFAFNPWQKDSLIVPDRDQTVIRFPENYRMLDQSIRIEKNWRILEAQVDFEFDHDQNQLTLFIPAQRNDTLLIHYTIQPILLKRNYIFFSIDTLRSADLTTDSLALIRHSFENPFTGFDSHLKRSGSIFRGVNVGNTRDLSIKSGLNLQISGYITDDVEVIAALTDEATPIQPEGNTQSLREVDKVYIRFDSPWVNGTLGDFNLQYSGSQFASLSRKLQGISLNGKYDGFQLGGTVGSTRGFFNFISFLGQESRQGPYQLTGRNDERDIIVLAGTERIWINSEKMVRGEDNDYIIDYATAQVTFSNRRLITSESRIEIDFEYYPAVQKFTRNVYSAISEGKVFEDKLNIKVKYYEEKDDPGKILEQEGILTEEEKEIIRLAGDDPLAASINSATLVGDSLGYYVRVDTLIETLPYTYYRYAGKNNGNYSVSFSSVGTGTGDYVRDRIGVYRWVGIGKGGYLPVKLLPLPQKHNLVDVEMAYAPAPNLSITGEYAATNLDLNTLSEFGDGNNSGQATRVTLDMKPTEIKIAGAALGRLNLSANGRVIDAGFQGVDRFNRPDFQRYWNILQSTPQTNEEKSWEASSVYQPMASLRLQGNLGRLKRAALESERYSGLVSFNDDNWFTADVNQEYVTSRQQQVSNDWTRQKAKIERTFGLFRPGLSFEREQRKNKSVQTLSGFDFNVWGAYIGLVNHTFLSGGVQYTRRADDVFDPEKSGEKIPQATTETGGLRLNLAEWNRWSGHFEFVLRKKDFTSYFENIKISSVDPEYYDPAVQDTVWRDQQTLLAELVVNNHQWSRAMDVRWQYRISTEQLALREKVYIDVGEGNGDFRYDELLDEYVPDPVGKFVLFVVPSSQFEPVTNLLTSLRLNIDPFRAIKKPASLFQNILTNLNSETYVRIAEETKTRNLNDLYFLNISKFQGEETTRGNITLNEDLYVMKRNRDISFRLRYRYSDNLLNQFLDKNENEAAQNTEKGIRATYRLFEKLRAQTEVREKLQYRDNASQKSRDRDINSTILNQNISWRPNVEWEFGLESENGWEKDDANLKNLELRYHWLLLRTTYALLRRGRITSDFEYQQVKPLSNPSGAPIPYEMARGKRAGVSKSWTLRAEYTLAENIVFSLSYNGRDDAGFEKIIHTGQAEVRAFF